MFFYTGGFVPLFEMLFDNQDTLLNNSFDKKWFMEQKRELNDICYKLKQEQKEIDKRIENLEKDL